MIALSTKLSQLEVAPVETAPTASPSEKNSSLETLIRTTGKDDPLEALMLSDYHTG